ncbi:hypothetical protein Q8F55_001704 [Vanrija albida]|uniref:Uncharacterized protein n=1 Tax=Vanrija albida TaxID=181172 RepID=A0ABR3Q8D2_9TREE
MYTPPHLRKGGGGSGGSATATATATSALDLNDGRLSAASMHSSSSAHSTADRDQRHRRPASSTNSLPRRTTALPAVQQLGARSTPTPTVPLPYAPRLSISVPSPARPPVPPMRTPRPGLSVLSSSPTSEMRPTPTRRTFSAPPGEMELLASVSRSGGLEDGGDALKDHDVQRRFRTYIDERIHRHHIEHPPGSGSEGELESLQSLVLLFRKLREGVVASHRLDDFAIDVFETSVQYAVHARNAPQLLSALSGLVPGLYLAVDAEKARLASESDGESTPNGVYTTAPGTPAAVGTPNVLDRSPPLSPPAPHPNNRTHFASLLLLYHLVHSSREVFHATYVSLALPPRRRPHAAPFVEPAQLEFARTAAKAMAPETFDPLLFSRLVGGHADRNLGGADEPADALERALLAWASPKVRATAGAMLKRAYTGTSVDWAAKVLCMEGSRGARGVDLWAMANGVMVDDGVWIKLR